MRLASLLVLCMLLLQGCGYKGPLYLPEKNPNANAPSRLAPPAGLALSRGVGADLA
jgi:predicted small lipoprotein YifL